MWPTEGIRDKANEGWSALDRRGRILAVLGLVILVAALTGATWLSILYGRHSGPTIYGQPSPSATLWIWDGKSYRSVAAATGPRSNEADLAYDARADDLVAWDHGCARLVLGFQGGCPNPVNQTWTWDGVTWTAHSPRSSPEVLGRGTALYDAKAARVEYVNGVGRVWAWTGSDWTGVPLPGGPNISAPGSASAPATFAAGFDDDRQLLVFALTSSTSTWDGSRWTEHPGGIPASEAGPTPEMVYDRGGHRLVYIGTHQTWTWDGDRWNAFAQPDIAKAGVAFDSELNVVVAIAQDNAACDRTACQAVTYRRDVNSWTRVAIDSGPLFPLSRSGATPPPLAFFPRLGSLVLLVTAA